jgi:hypothetical protein
MITPQEKAQFQALEKRDSANSGVEDEIQAAKMAREISQHLGLETRFVRQIENSYPYELITASQEYFFQISKCH